MKRKLIIVAGGSGSRMKSAIPKQFLLLNGLPVLMRTMAVFYSFDSTMEIIVVLPSAQHDHWKELCKQYSFCIKHRIVEGGQERFHSVKNALRTITEHCYIAVHDSVRPLVSVQTIGRCFDQAALRGNAIPVVELTESIRRVTNDSNSAINRSEYRLVQTPQVFDSLQIQMSYNTDYQSFFTDDASVVEYAGNKIHLVEGNRENIKITTPMDLKMAAALL